MVLALQNGNALENTQAAHEPVAARFSTVLEDLA
jgi:hypothetical protein